MNTLGISKLIALIVLILSVLCMMLGTVPVWTGALIDGLAVAKLL
jgi:hypothetical protein